MRRVRNRPDRFVRVPYGEPPSDRSYEVEGVHGARLAVVERGPAEAAAGAVFLHGYCLDHTVWHHQMEELSGPYRLLFYDARAHGRSTEGHGPMTVETLAEDLEAVVDQSGLSRAVLVGHSMGGMTALEFSRRFTGEMENRVCGMVLVNTTFTDALKTVFASEVLGPLDRRLRGGVEGLLGNPRASSFLRLRGDDLSWMLVKLFGFGAGASPRQVSYVRKLLAQFPSPPLVEILRGMRAFDMEEALRAIDVPVLIIAGGDDRITTVPASERMAEEIPGAWLNVMERTGHLAMMERPEQFNALVEQFLQSVLGEDAEAAGGTR